MKDFTFFSKLLSKIILISLIGNLVVVQKVNGLTNDIAITEVSPLLDLIQGEIMSTNISIVNEGDSTQTFDVDIYVEGVNTNDDLVVYWSFDEGSGKIANDDSGNLIKGIIYGATWSDGKFGQALNLDGNNDYVIAPHIPLYHRSFSITMWINAIRLPDPPEDAPLLTQLDDDSLSKYMHLIIRDYSPYFGFWIDDLTENTRIIPGVWYHLAFIYDYFSNMKYIYVNGMLDASIESIGSYEGLSGDTNVGTYYGGGKTFEGNIDELRIYNRALNKQEIEAVVGSGLVQTQTITLLSGNSKNFTFTWNLLDVEPGNYTIRAVVSGVPGETDIDDNEITSYIITLIDSDEDGVVDLVDPDDDNDGVPDVEDVFALDSSEWIDSDEDGTGDNADQDDDNDGVPDVEDVFALDSSEWIDSDEDGTGDNADQDDDNDGMSDNWETDYSLNLLDPSDASLDSDGDGLTNIEEFQKQTNPKSYFSPFPTLVVGTTSIIVVVLVAVIYLIKKEIISGESRLLI
jgi:hypothetical protein